MYSNRAIFGVMFFCLSQKKKGIPASILANRFTARHFSIISILKRVLSN